MTMAWRGTQKLRFQLNLEHGRAVDPGGHTVMGGFHGLATAVVAVVVRAQQPGKAQQSVHGSMG